MPAPGEVKPSAAKDLCNQLQGESCKGHKCCRGRSKRAPKTLDMNIMTFTVARIMNCRWWVRLLIVGVICIQYLQLFIKGLTPELSMDDVCDPFTDMGSYESYLWHLITREGLDCEFIDVGHFLKQYGFNDDVCIFKNQVTSSTTMFYYEKWSKLGYRWTGFGIIRFERYDDYIEKLGGIKCHYKNKGYKLAGGSQESPHRQGMYT